MWKKILICILVVWAMVFTTDIITAFTIHHPIFCLSGPSTCKQPYYGLGYSITYFDAMTPKGLYIDKYPTINFSFYLVINVIFILFYIFNKHIFKQRNK